MAGDPVRIAFVIGELGTGGAEYQLFELVRGLDRGRYLPRVFALATGGYWAGRLRDLGVDVQELRHVRSADLSRLVTLRRGLSEFAPQILHTVLWSGNAYGRLASVGLRIPVVITAERNVVRRPAWQVVFERALDVVTDRYLVNSRAIVAELVERGRLPRRKIQVIHNGIDLDRLPAFDPDRRGARTALGFDPVRRLVVQVGRLEEQKDHPTFLAAAARVAARVPDVDFLVVGEGGLRAGLEAIARGLGIAERVRFTGVRHDVPALLAGCDACTLTSLYEGLPNVVIEAMATGAVAVATDVGGARELVVSGETGYVVPVRDVEAVAGAVTAVLADAERARAMAVAARRRIEDGFTVEAMVRDTTAAYDELLRAAAAGAPVRHAA